MIDESTTFCEECLQDVRLKDLRKHNGKNGVCIANLVLCRCKKFVRKVDLAFHLRFECNCKQSKRAKKVFVQKRNPEKIMCQGGASPVNIGCGKLMLLKELKNHLNHHCEELIIRRRFLSRRRNKENRDHVCSSCHKEGFTFSEKNEHELISCDKRQVTCPNYRHGCSLRLKADEVNEHLKSFCMVTLKRIQLLKNKNERAGLSVCFLGCGLKIRNREMSQHQKNTCSFRLTMCKCGIEIPFSLRDKHMLEEVYFGEMSMPRCKKRSIREEMIKNRNFRLKLKQKCYERKLELKTD